MIGWESQSLGVILDKKGNGSPNFAHFARLIVSYQEYKCTLCKFMVAKC